MRKKRHLTIDEKRDWLACVFRDENGEFSQADKFKAMVEDTKLAVLQAEQETLRAPAQQQGPDSASLLDLLPPPLAKTTANYTRTCE